MIDEISKKEVRFTNLRDHIESLLLDIQGTVTRDHDGDTLSFQVDAYETYSSCLSKIGRIASNDVFSKKYRKNLKERISIIEDNLIYLKEEEE